MSNPSLSDLNQETRAIWNRNAAHWDQRMADGNDFQRLAVGPAAERLLAPRPGELILEIACGNGVMARRLAEMGARVVATDFAEQMVEQARARGDGGGAIEYFVVDATDENDLRALGRRRFDGAICNMAIMDMAAVDPLMFALPKLLKPRGRFVFSLTHPCFNSSGCTRTFEESERDGEVVAEHSVKVWAYATLGIRKGLAMRGQPVPQYYFNRTLSELLGACFRAGMVVDGMEEPVFPRADEPQSFVHWNLFAEIPPVLVVRTRLVQN